MNSKTLLFSVFLLFGIGMVILGSSFSGPDMKGRSISVSVDGKVVRIEKNPDDKSDLISFDDIRIRIFRSRIELNGEKVATISWKDQRFVISYSGGKLKIETTDRVLFDNEIEVSKESREKKENPE